MSDTKRPAGTISWVDISIPDAEPLRDFYAEVIGWSPQPVEMNGYADYAMAPHGTDDPVAGVCHARGPNSDLPPQWLMYVSVEDLDQSMKRCQELGGQIIAGPRSLGADCRFCVIQDPAGAVLAIHEVSG